MMSGQCRTRLPFLRSPGIHNRRCGSTLSWQSIAAASRVMEGAVQETPLLESPALNALTGGRILVKAESLQRGGSFKVRGALNKLLTLEEHERQRGVIAFSSGNFAQGLALAAAETGTHATLVMPDDAPQPKVQRTRDYGATVEFSTPATKDENREVAAARIASRLAEKRGLTLLHPFNDDAVIAGQGTVGWEIAAQAKQQRASAIDLLLVCCGGGGLVAGCSLAIKHHFPDCEILPVEPAGYDGAVRSLAAGQVTAAPGLIYSSCDSLQAPAPGEKPFEVLKHTCMRGLTVDDAAVPTAMAVAFDMMKLVLEPGGAIALAAVLAGQVDVAGRTVVVVASGGNVAWEKFSHLLQEVQKKDK